jgi:hypothetical protein
MLKMRLRIDLFAGLFAVTKPDNQNHFCGDLTMWAYVTTKTSAQEGT